MTFAGTSGAGGWFRALRGSEFIHQDSGFIQQSIGLCP